MGTEGSLADSLAGTVLNDTYRLERLIGEGGMGSVYEASHLRVRRRYAVKLLNREFVHSREVSERFRREAEIASSLGSEHIVQVFDFNQAADGRHYFVMELLDGEDLAARLARVGRLTMKQTASLLDQVSMALEVAHAAGIVHRDLKPGNIFLVSKSGRTVAKILDFGISKIMHQSSIATRTGMILGTPNYMAPEQAEGRIPEIDRRADVFSLGAILYECLTGRRAFDAPTPVGAILQVCTGQPAPMRDSVPDMPEAVEGVIARALAKQPADRWPSVDKLRDAFVAACGVTPETPTRPISGFPPRSTAPMTTTSDQSMATPMATTSDEPAAAIPKQRGPALVTTAIALAAIAIAWVTFGRDSEESPPHEVQPLAPGLPAGEMRAAAAAAEPPVAPPALEALPAGKAAPKLSATGRFRTAQRPPPPQTLRRAAATSTAEEAKASQPAGGLTPGTWEAAPPSPVTGGEAPQPTPPPAAEGAGPEAPPDVVIHLALDPPDAIVEVDGKRATAGSAANPLLLPLGSVHTVRVSHLGYESMTRRLRFDASVTLRFRLAKRGSGSTSDTPPAPEPSPAPPEP